MAGPIGLRGALVQVDCYTDSTTGVTNAYYTVRALSKAVRQALGAFTGNLPDADATAVQAVFTEKDSDMPYEEGSKGYVFVLCLNFVCGTSIT